MKANSDAPIKERLAFLLKWKDAISANVLLYPKTKFGIALKKWWSSKVVHRWNGYYATISRLITEPSKDTLQQLKAAPAHLDQWETTFASVDQIMAKRDGKTSGFTPGARANKMVGPNLAVIVKDVVADGLKEAVKLGKITKDEAVKRLEGLSKSLSGIPWLALLLAGGALYYFSKRD